LSSCKDSNTHTHSAPEIQTQTTYLSEEGRQNLAKFSHGEEPYLSLIRTAQLLDHLRIKGWPLRHITQHEYAIYLVSGSKNILVHKARIEKRDYPYIFISLRDDLEVIEVSNTASVSTSVSNQIPSGRYRTDPIPNEAGIHNLFTSYDKKHRIDLILSSGE